MARTKGLWSRWMTLCLAVGLASGAAAVPLPIRTIGANADDYPDGAACASRLTISATFYQACTDLCVTDAQCPANWLCKPIAQGSGDDIYVCAPRRVVQ
ncbi:MAG: hypothetical protein U1E65_29430 [Myxococcota bacterium]